MKTTTQRYAAWLLNQNVAHKQMIREFSHSAILVECYANLRRDNVVTLLSIRNKTFVM